MRWAGPAQEFSCASCIVIYLSGAVQGNITVDEPHCPSSCCFHEQVFPSHTSLKEKVALTCHSWWQSFHLSLLWTFAIEQHPPKPPGVVSQWGPLCLFLLAAHSPPHWAVWRWCSHCASCSPNQSWGLQCQELLRWLKKKKKGSNHPRDLNTN